MFIPQNGQYLIAFDMDNMLLRMNGTLYITIYPMTALQLGQCMKKYAYNKAKITKPNPISSTTGEALKSVRILTASPETNIIIPDNMIIIIFRSLLSIVCLMVIFNNHAGPSPSPRRKPHGLRQGTCPSQSAFIPHPMIIAS
jgi:hypothetical protein